MPLYAYRCTQCGHTFEKIQSFSSQPEMVCPQCSGPLERPLTAPGLSFKGAGWYVNDYASRPSSGSDNKPASDSASVGAADSKSDSNKSDSKPATESKPASTESTSKPASSSTPTTT